MARTFSVVTYGCQMNAHDSERISGLLEEAGYVRAEDCDRGEWAFRDGKPVPFGPEPALVHYEALRERGEPHYV